MHLKGSVPVLYQASQQVNEEEMGSWSVLADARPVKRFRTSQEVRTGREVDGGSEERQAQRPSMSTEVTGM